MKKISAIFIFHLIINSHLHSMQSSLQLTQQNGTAHAQTNAISVRFTGIRDGIDVIIKERDARASKVLDAFLNFPPNSQTLQTREKVWPLDRLLFTNFIDSFDIKEMVHYLSCISNKIDICQDCCNETIDKNIKQLLLSNFFDIEQLSQAEINAITQKFKNLQELLSVYKNNPELFQLMQSIPEHMQEEIIKKLKASAPFYMQYILIGNCHVLNPCCKFSPDGTRIITISNNKEACIWNTKSGKLINKFNVESDVTCYAEFSPDNSHIATTSRDNNISIWNISTNRLVHTLQHPNVVLFAAFSHNGNLIATTSSDSILRIWNTQTGQLMQRYELSWLNPMDLVRYAEFSPDDNQLLATSDLGDIIVWDIRTNQSGTLPELFSHWTTLAKFSPDGSYIATNSFGGDLWIWDARTGQSIHSINIGQLTANRSNENNYNYHIQNIEFNSTGDKVVIVTNNGTTKIYDLPTGQLLSAHQKRGNGQIWTAQFSPDGDRIITAQDSRPVFRRNEDSSSNDDNAHLYGTVCIWNTQTGELMHTLKETSQIMSAEFSPDGNRILTRSGNGISHLWVNSLDIINVNNNRHALEQALFMQLIASNRDCDQILDLNTMENRTLKHIFKTFNPKERRYIKRVLHIKNSSKNHEHSAAASSI